jgi:hypothetical protein
MGNINCVNLNNEKCNKISNCYYIKNSCIDKKNFFSLKDIESNNIKCSITRNESTPDLFNLYCVNTNKIKDILIKGLIIDNSCLNNSENNSENKKYLYEKKCNILLSNNILNNNEFNIKNNIITFDINGNLTIIPRLNITQVNKIKENNNIINLIDIYNNKLEIKVNIYLEISKVKRDNFFKNKNINLISKTYKNINEIIQT